MGRAKGLFEDIVAFLILLSLSQIVLEELAWIFLWTPRLRTTLLLSGFWFDLAFSLEFLIRSLIALRKRAFGRYFLRELGWLDFLCSFPLLIGASGPVFLSAMAGSLTDMAVRGGLGILKILKTVRVVRLLKVLRPKGLAGSFFRRAPLCAQRQVCASLCAAMLPVAAVSLLISAFLARPFPLASDLNEASLVAQRLEKAYGEAFKTETGQGLDRLIAILEPEVLSISQGSGILYEGVDRSDILTALDVQEGRSPGGSLLVRLSILSENRKAALSNLTLYAIIISIFLSLLLFYAPYLVKRLSAPLSALVEAQEAGSPYPRLDAPEGAEDEEVFILARGLEGKGGKL